MRFILKIISFHASDIKTLKENQLVADSLPKLEERREKNDDILSQVLLHHLNLLCEKQNIPAEGGIVVDFFKEAFVLVSGRERSIDSGQIHSLINILNNKLRHYNYRAERVYVPSRYSLKIKPIR